MSPWRQTATSLVLVSLHHDCEFSMKDSYSGFKITARTVGTASTKRTHHLRSVWARQHDTYRYLLFVHHSEASCPFNRTTPQTAWELRLGMAGDGVFWWSSLGIKGFSHHVHRDVKKLVAKRNLAASYKSEKI